MFEYVEKMIKKVRHQQPLILNLTNEVTMAFVANGLLSLGASPIMSTAEDEIEDLLKIANVLVINLGTLNKSFLQLVQKACTIANKKGVPIVLDPVGAGASDYRTRESQNLLKNHHIAIIRGNASEISALAGENTITKGVDSSQQSYQAKQAAQQLSQVYQTTVCISGREDFILKGSQEKMISRGSPLMPKITGTGCLLSAVVGAFHAVEEEAFVASWVAALFYSLCGELAHQKTDSPGSFYTHFLDALFQGPTQDIYDKK